MKTILIATFSLISVAAFADEIRVIPDSITPGEIATVDEADICSRVGGSYSQRHRLTQTPLVKREVLTRYGVDYDDRAKYEDDHNVPLCIGGADTVANRWPQPRTGLWNAGQKDKLEAYACHEVCITHSVKLNEAQGWFIAPADWRTAYCKYFNDPACAELGQLKP